MKLPQVTELRSVPLTPQVGIDDTKCIGVKAASASKRRQTRADSGE
jgi:hypothetical protein